MTRSKNKKNKKRASKENPAVEKEEKVEPVVRVVRFYEGGKIEWEGFSNIYDTIGFMQTHIFRDWDNPIFSGTILNDMRTPPKQDEIPEQEKPVEDGAPDDFYDEHEDDFYDAQDEAIIKRMEELGEELRILKKGMEEGK